MKSTRFTVLICAAVAGVCLSASNSAAMKILNRCPADIDGSTVVDGADLAALLAAWGTANPAADLNGDGTVDGADLAILLAAWGPC